jgi:hypothetical protein
MTSNRAMSGWTPDAGEFSKKVDAGNAPNSP